MISETGTQEQKTMMRFVQRIVEATLLFGALFIAFSGTAHAYVDAGTGSYFLQMAIGGLVGGMFTLKVFWGNIRRFFAGLGGKAGSNTVDAR
jgi:hypothetical protein